MEKLTEGKELEKYIPHRGINILIHQAKQEDDKTIFSFDLSSASSEAQRLFAIKAPHQDHYLPYLFAEFLALGTIVSLGQLDPDHIALFASIANFSLSEPLKKSEILQGHANRQKDRGPLRRFAGKFYSDQHPNLGQADISAFIVSTKDEQREEKKKIDPPQIKFEKPIQSEIFSWKAKEMIFIDQCVYQNLESPSLTTEYLYPAGHPFVQGHFPGNPIMMGITQWMMVADTMYTLYHLLGLSHQRQNISANASILKEDGTLVIEAKQVQLICEGSNSPMLKSTKRILFRDLVRPNEKIYCQLENVVINPA